MLTISLLLLSPVITVGSPQSLKNPNKIVCQLESVIGTRIPQRVCRTEAQWAEIAEQSKYSMENVLNKYFGKVLSASPR